MNSIVELKKYVIIENSGKKMLIVLDLNIVQKDAKLIGNMNYDFKKLDTLEQLEVNSFADVLAIVKEYGEVQEITSKKSGAQIPKRELKLVDDTNVEVQLTLWGEDAQAPSRRSPASTSRPSMPSQATLPAKAEST